VERPKAAWPFGRQPTRRSQSTTSDLVSLAPRSGERAGERGSQKTTRRLSPALSSTSQRRGSSSIVQLGSHPDGIFPEPSNFGGPPAEPEDFLGIKPFLKSVPTSCREARKAEQLFRNSFLEFKVPQCAMFPLIRSQGAVLGVQCNGKAKSRPGLDFVDNGGRIRKT